LEARLAASTGTVVVQFSSDDKNCGFCVQSNPRFDTLADVRSNKAKFIRVMWNPYLNAFDDRLAILYGFKALPRFMTFKDGKEVKRVDGSYVASQLSEYLLNGVD
jgi:thiol-disulfide isomerase/thioredoxin